MQPAPLSRLFAIALFGAMVMLAADVPMLVLAFEDREMRQDVLARRADPDPELAAFLGEVRARTQRGQSVALLLPQRDWRSYSGAYFRASYLLAGRTVLPVIGTRNEVLADNVARADTIAVWHVRYPDGEVVWKGHGGSLVRRR